MLNIVDIIIIIIIISIIGVIIAIKTHRIGKEQLLLKLGEEVRGSSGVVESIRGVNYISTITIINLKDKPLTVYGIAVKFGHNNLVSLNIGKTTIDGFRIHTWTFEQPLHYTTSTAIVDLKHLFEQKRELILTTPNGKLLVKPNQTNKKLTVSEKNRNRFINDEYFHNEYTNIFHTTRIKYKDKSYGSNVRYLVDIVKINGENEVIDIYNDLKKIKGVKLSTDSLKSAKTLNEFLQKKKDSGEFPFKTLSVVDFNYYVKKEQDKYKSTIQIMPMSFWEYYVIGSYKTKQSIRKVRKMNKQNKKGTTARTRKMNKHKVIKIVP